MLVCLASWVCACVEAAGPPADAVRFEPLGRYHGWWALTEACSGLTADFSAVRWYLVPNRYSILGNGEVAGGAYYPHGNQIVLADTEQYIGSVVRHEMLHALMPKVGGHPRHQFLDRCGDIVACDGPCATDAGGPPDWSTTAPFVAATALTIGILAPSPVSQGVDSGWTPITVTVTNSAPYAVRVATPPPAPLPPSDSGLQFSEAFKYVITPPPIGRFVDTVTNPQQITYLPFAPAGTPGSTRRVVFDLEPTFSRAAVGDYNVTGLFLTDATAALVVSVGP